jgi:hypothetical protein
MARPAINPILSGAQNWDDRVDDNFTRLGKAPIPIHENASLTESTVTATFPPSSYDRCLVWVNHSVIGYTLYESNGTLWRPFAPKFAVVAFSSTRAMLVSDNVVRATGGGGIDLDLTTAANYRGRILIVRNDSSGNLDLDPSGSETINGGGAGAALVLATGTRTRIYSDGAAWWEV